MSEATKAWTVLELIQWTAGFLGQKGIEKPKREAEDLLGHVLELDRLKLYLAFEALPSPAELSKFRDLVARRAKREPLQYLTGWQPFMGLKIKADARALIPRPETERLAELALERLKPCGQAGFFADIGCGSGCISLALLNGSECQGIATDSSAEALALASENAIDLGLAGRVKFSQGWGIDALKGAPPLDLIVSNPPYIPEGERASLQPEVRDYEPAQALFAGPDGLAVSRGICAQAAAHLKPGAWLALELAAGQPQALMALMNKAEWADLKTEKDQYGVERFLLAQRL